MRTLAFGYMCLLLIFGCNDGAFLEEENKLEKKHPVVVQLNDALDYINNGAYDSAVAYLNAIDRSSMGEVPKDQQIRFFILHGLNEKNHFNFKLARTYFDSAITFYTNNSDVTIKRLTFSLVNKGQCYINEAEFDSAIAVFDQVIKLKDSKEIIKNLLSAYGNKGVCYNYKEQHQQAIDTYREGFKLQKQYEDNFGMVYFLDNIAQSFHQLHQVDSAIYYHLRALEIPITNQFVKEAIINNLAGIFIAQNEHQKAHDLCKSYMDTAEVLENSPIYSAWAIIVGNMGDTLTAKELYLKEYHHSKAIRSSQRFVTSVVNLGSAYLSLGKMDSAFSYLQEGIQVAQQFGLMRNLAQAHKVLGDYYSKKGDDDSVKYHYQKSLSISQDIDYEYFISLNHKLLSEVYQKSDLQKANDHAKKYIELYEKISQKRYNKDVAEAEEKYQNEVLAKENQQLALIDAEKTITMQRFRTLSLVIAFAAVLVILLVNRQRQVVKNNLIKEKSKAQARELKARDEVSSKIGAELHDGVAGKITQVAHALEDRIPEACVKLKEVVGEIRTLTYHLNASHSGEEGDKSLFDILDKLVPRNKGFKMSVHPIEMKVSGEAAAQLHFIFSELITNNIKHAQAKHTRIRVQKTESTLELSYIDDGIGTDKVKAGQGLNNMEARVKTMNGKIQVKSAEGDGFQVKIELPLSILL